MLESLRELLSLQQHLHVYVRIHIELYYVKYMKLITLYCYIYTDKLHNCV